VRSWLIAGRSWLNVDGSGADSFAGFGGRGFGVSVVADVDIAVVIDESLCLSFFFFFVKFVN
jgi:hypothetical protein